MTSNRFQNINQHLIEGCKRGDSRSQFEIYEQYHKAMYNTCLRLVSNPTEAEDILQESFFKAFDKIGTYRNEVSFGAWLKRIVVNASLDFLKKKKLNLIQIETAYGIHESGTEPDDIEPETLEQLMKAIEALPHGYRVIVNLVLVEGYSHDEVGAMLGITASTSRSQLARAKQKLMDALKK